MKKPFRMLPPNTIHKSLIIAGPDDDREKRIVLDYDDVNHPEVHRYARRVVAVLNAGWAASEPKARARP